ncbi:AraC-type DNA-binding protein [Paenibacillus sp. yr247]|uniref:helix-turn-helix domain-containing protein n=1 Tax=Paenibacillus sp. yr247 TaxID=1761880 RepID=UPI00088A3AAB|nr:AraC family transcriptional regulator [Paenibacillus sp. yr247]SDO19206.1 AraC-type DNA-binding protein [Paenibacillus sp. yr247]
MKIYTDSDFFRRASFPLFIDQYTIGKGEKIPSHSHSFHELMYVLEGDASHEMMGVVYQLKPGDLFVLEPGMGHSFQGTDQETKVYNVMFQRECLHHELSRLSEIPEFMKFFYLAPFLRMTSSFYPYTNVAGTSRMQLEAKLQTMEQEHKHRKPGFELLLRTQLIEMFVLVSRDLMQVQEAERDQSQQNQDWINLVVAMLKQQYTQPLQLKQFSRMCGMSPSSFAQKFKRFTGRSFLSYKQELQLQEACRLLHKTEKTILEVAQEAGYDDLSYFYRIFRKKMGMPPVQYRKKRVDE